MAPARNLECAEAAILCGADAVYMAAGRFGARSGAENSLKDIERAVILAHRYRARIYAAVNTILSDAELPEAAGLIGRLHESGVDAVIIQDQGLLEMDLPPVPLIASTQMHNDCLSKVLFLEKAGFSRVILARELSLEEIREIRAGTSVELECFVHGALCYSYSGQCCLSFAMGGRSGNRGECAQPCRKTYSLMDSDGKVLVRNRYLLSMRDLNLSEHLRDLIEAGVTSLKIEGRLKDACYVRNTVAFYRRKLDEILPLCGARKSSSGRSLIPFVPDPLKTFNRGYCDLYLGGRKRGVLSMDTQKSTGEPIGRVVAVGSGFFSLENDSGLRNGDGICFFDADGNLRGTLVRQISGGKVFPENPAGIIEGTFVFRNHDVIFERELRGVGIKRKISLRFTLAKSTAGIRLEAEDEDGVRAAVEIASSGEITRDRGKAVKEIVSHLSRLGGTDFEAVECRLDAEPLPHLTLRNINGARRAVVSELERNRAMNYPRKSASIQENDYPYPEKKLTFRANVLNSLAERFYRRHGVESIEPAAESGIEMRGRTVMTTRHCLRFHLGLCSGGGRSAGSVFSEPLFLVDEKGIRHALSFDCENCRMEIVFQS